MRKKMIAILLLVNTLALLINISIFVEYSSYLSDKSKDQLANIEDTSTDNDESPLDSFEEEQEIPPEYHKNPGFNNIDYDTSLKSCPFCGSDDVYYFQYYNKSWVVCCDHCCASSSIWDISDTSHHFTKEEAKILWNKLKR